LISEKDKLKHLQERLINRKEEDALKYQKEIDSLKEELKNIETHYVQEVKKLEEQFNKYREDKNSKIKIKIKEMQEMYESKMEKERQNNKDLEIELAENKTLLLIL
jgi:flagellin-like hook-associated protein FlgL